NRNKTDIGVNVTASFTGGTATGIVQFRGNDRLVDTPYAFVTQSLLQGSTNLKTFEFSGVNIVSSSAPSLSSDDTLTSIVVANNATTESVTRAAVTAINSLATIIGTGQISASFESNGIVIQRNPARLYTNGGRTGAGDPFIYRILQSGSGLPIPPDNSNGSINLPIEVGNFDTDTLVSQSVHIINEFMLDNGVNANGSIFAARSAIQGHTHTFQLEGAPSAVNTNI
ncbi:MAG TPA: hypothetical protein DCM40_20845, partial [Maribacter sp.]|nr:hypothetical protein [Maribacter sp.]